MAFSVLGALNKYLFVKFSLVALLLSSGLCLAELPYAGSTVHVLLVLDKHAENVGDKIVVGGDRLIKSLKDIRSRLGTDGKMNIHVLGMGDNPVRPEEIFAYYRNLRIRTNDALFFYYNGHGATDVQRGHFLAMSGGDVLRAKVLEAMQAHNPRLAVMASDACSSLSRYQGSNGTYSAPVAGTQRFGIAGEDTRTVFRDLFFSESGVVDFTSAQAPQYAYAPPGGGIFTVVMADLLNADSYQVDVDGNGKIVWNEFLRSVRWDVRERLEALKSGGYRLSAFGRVEDDTKQTPELFKFPSYKIGESVQLIRMKAAVDGVKFSDASGSGLDGYYITVDSTIWQAKGRNVRVEAHFRYLHGPQVRATDTKYRDDGGNLASWAIVTPKHEASNFPSIKLFVPGRPLRQSKDAVGVYINIRDVQTEALLGGSPFLNLK